MAEHAVRVAHVGQDHPGGRVVAQQVAAVGQHQRVIVDVDHA
jgi:hypothetical protein